MKPQKWMQHFNEKVAVLGTKFFGNMWTTYIFCIWGLIGILPWFPQHYRDFVLLVSSGWIQLWALPLLAVGNTVLNRSVEKRAKEDHQSIRAQLQELKDLQSDNDKILASLQTIQDTQTTILDHLESHVKKTKGA